MKFRKKQIILDCEQWFPGKPVDGVEEFESGDAITEVIGRIVTLEKANDGYDYVMPGDWIVTGVKGEKYCVKESIFPLLYEPIAEKTKVVVLCGSSRFVDIMAVCAWLIERDEKAITMGLHLLPEWYCKGEIPDHIAEHEGVAREMDSLHLCKIDLADEIFVVNFLDYIGDSTSNEIAYAKNHGKAIRWFTHDPVGKTVRSMAESLHH